MAEFRYAIFGDPVVRPLPPPHEEPTWRLSVQTDRVKWLLRPLGPFVLDRNLSWAPRELVLRRASQARTPRLVDKVRFVVFRTQGDAVDGLLSPGPDALHFVPAITDPAQQARIPKEFGQQIMEKWNINYLGFRVDRMDLQTRKQIAGIVSPSAIRSAAGIPSSWGSHDMAPLRFAHRRHRPPAPFSFPNLTFAFNRANELDARVGDAIVKNLSLTANQIHTTDNYPDLIEYVKNDPAVGMFLYNWYIQKPSARRAQPAAWRLLYPLFHSRCIGHTNLMHHDRGTDDLAIEALLTNPAGADGTLAAIMATVPLIVLYHAVRIAAWNPRVSGLSLRDPDAQPVDRLKAVTLR